MSTNHESAWETMREACAGTTPPAWVRVGMDSGGIAAGAERVLECLQNGVDEAGLDAAVCRAGSRGHAFADPLVEVKSAGREPVLYGRVDEEVAEAIVSEHLVGGRLLDDHILFTPAGVKEPGANPVEALLVLDTSPGPNDRTALMQSAFLVELECAAPGVDVQVVRALDMGIHGEGVVVAAFPSGLTYANVLARDVPRIIANTVLKRKTVASLLWERPDLQCRIVLGRCGEIDPESIDDAIQRGAYRGLAKALDGTPDVLIESVKTSGLRGRGGAGYPTGVKWELTRRPQAERKFVICNADEGDPGAFMDRSVLEGDPHAVLEGLMLAAYAVGAEKGYFYIRAEYPLAVKRVGMAIEQARAKGLLGENVMGSGWAFDADIRLGAGAFVCGEETALIASIEGRRGSPEPRPPYPSVRGLWGMPTCINNVETLAAVPWIATHGANAYASIGSGKSRGTKVFAVTGKVRHARLVEVPMGTTVRQIIFDICGGAPDDVPVKGVQTGGPSGGIIPESHLDTPVTYETLQELGSIMGSGGMLVMNGNDCMVDVAAFYLKFCVDESCGKCAPCRVGGYQLSQLLQKITKGRGVPEDLERIRRIGTAMRSASLCGLGQTAPNPVLSSLRFFEDEYLSYIEGGVPYARKLRKAMAEGRNLVEVV